MDFHSLTPMKVVFHPRIPIVLAYEVGPCLIVGDPNPQEPSSMVYSPEHGRNECTSAAGLDVASTVREHGREREYAVSLRREGRHVIRFLLVYSRSESDLRLSLLDVNETDGWQLVHVDVHRLASAATTDPSSRIILASHGGRRIDPSRCEAGERLHRYNWVYEPFSQVAAAYGDGACVIVQLESLNDILLSSVTHEASRRFASIGARLTHRLEARSPQLQFTVHRNASVRMTMLPTDVADARTGWVPAARWLHARNRKPVGDPYAGRFVYKIFVGKPGTPCEISFDAALDGVRRRYHLFDGGEQLGYLIGFQHEGHDSGYPHVLTANEAAGGLESLRRIIQEARAFNTTLSFHDNYDDAYESSPSWDPADIGTDRNGELLKGGTWNGVQAYWISLPKYVASKAPDRLRATLDLYPVRDTYHLDVLTASVFRPDYDPSSPSDRNDDFSARTRLVELFRGHGLDVTTEACGLPFLETFRYFWDLPRPAAPVYSGDEPIPLAPFIAHGTTCYGGSEADRYGIVEGLYHGAFHSKDFSARTTEAEMLDAYYLLFVPLDLLRDRSMASFEERDAWRRISYDDGSTVEVDFERLEHRVIVRGRLIVEDFISFAPGTRVGTWRLYVSSLQEMGTRRRRSTWPCPAEWRGLPRLEATALTPEGDGETASIPVREDGTIPLDLPPGIPWRVQAGVGA